MDVYLAAVSLQPYVLNGRKDLDSPFLLESFFYSSKKQDQVISATKNLLIDSGAFTFVGSAKDKGVDWLEYVDRYADFIKKNNVKLFFELDIDALIGYEKVLKLRKRLETRAERQCIPVWHKTRGKQNFIDMCKEYSYVSIGGIVSREFVPGEYKYFPWFIDTAHQHSAKIHGLGFTNLKGLKKYHFDSVDSTSWKSGNRFGGVYIFNGSGMEHRQRQTGERMTNTRDLLSHNFNEWVKFQKYAKQYL